MRLLPFIRAGGIALGVGLVGIALQWPLILACVVFVLVFLLIETFLFGDHQ